MFEINLKQAQYESETWKRLLTFMLDENVYLKNRISEVVRQNIDRRLLNEIENFQNSFVREDELIGLLRNDIAEFEDLLNQRILENGNAVTKINGRLQKIRTNILQAEREFSKLKTNFNSYLAANI